MESDALATRGLVSINPSGAGFDAFADALATRGYIFLVHEILLGDGLDLFRPQIKSILPNKQIKSILPNKQIKWTG